VVDTTLISNPIVGNTNILYSMEAEMNELGKRANKMTSEMEQYDRCVERRLCTLANRCEHLEQRKNRLL
jgi:hypothetical protein